jgi:hypothetical protein
VAEQNGERETGGGVELDVHGIKDAARSAGFINWLEVMGSRPMLRTDTNPNGGIRRESDLIPMRNARRWAHPGFECLQTHRALRGKR